MRSEILEFISRRFPHDCDANWLYGNCYYFALILKSRFPSGDIIYDPIEGHFLFKFDDEFYDFRGQRSYSYRDKQHFYCWDKLKQIDEVWYDRIVRDCVM